MLVAALLIAYGCAGADSLAPGPGGARPDAAADGEAGQAAADDSVAHRADAVWFDAQQADSPTVDPAQPDATRGQDTRLTDATDALADAANIADSNAKDAEGSVLDAPLPPSDAGPLDVVSDAADASDANPAVDVSDLADALTTPDASDSTGTLDTQQTVDTSQSPDTTQWPPLDAGDPTMCPFGKTIKELGCGFQGVCAGKTKISCYGDQPACDYSDAVGWQAWETLCDGLDNDCDGLADNNLAKPPAKTWPKVGVCAKALQACGGPGGWVEPAAWQVPNYEPVEVSCDGLDNDCDGVTDADIDASSPLAKIPKWKGKGVCGTLDMVCVAGVWQAPNPDSAPGWEQTEKTCDGLDNDCDGQIDEALLAPLHLPSGGQLLTDGVCAGAKPACVNGVWQAPNYYAYVAGLPSKVTLTYEAVETRCDGLDNDCDGETDEGLTGPLAAQQQGVCKGARKVCSGGWQEPSYTQIAGYSSGAEVACDGLDNNCDGVVDEGLVCPVWQLGGRNLGGFVASKTAVAWAAGAGVVVHSVQTAARVATHLQHEQPVLGMALSPDGTRLATVGAGQVLRIRSLIPGASTLPKTVIDAPGKTWTAVAFDPKGGRLAVADDVGWLRVLPLPQATGGLAKKAHSGPVRRLHWLASGPWAGARLWTGDAQGKLVTWRPNTLVTKSWKLPFTGAAAGKPGPVQAIAANAAGTHVAVAWRAAGVVVFGVEKGVVLSAPVLAGFAPSALTFDAQGRLWVGNEAGDLRRYKPGKSASWGLDWSLAAVKPSPGGGPVALPGAIVELRMAPGGDLWVAGRRAAGRRTLQGAWTALGWPLRAAPTALVTQPGRWLIGDSQGRVEAHAWQTGQGVWAATLHGGKAISALAARPSSAHPNLATAGADGITHAGTLSPGPQVSWQPAWSQASPAAPQRLAWHGSALYRGAGPQVRGFDLSASGVGGGQPIGKLIFQLQLPSGASVDDLAVDSAGQRLALTSSHAAGELRVVAISTAKTLWARKQLASPRRLVAWRSDGSELLVSGGSVGVQVVSAKTGKTTIPLPGHLSQVTALAWSADGKRMLTASRDGAVRLWRRNGSGVIGLTTRVRHCVWPCTALGGVAGLGFRDATGSAWVTVGADGGVIGWRLP